jgi:two-component system, OmpR family, KDP operon response regulator KdpE
MTQDPPKPEVLVVDADGQTRCLLRPALEGAGYAFREAATGGEGIREMSLRTPAILVVELALPDLPGAEVVSRVREWSGVPILVLSAITREADKIGVLDLGADDYLTKPFGLGELLARLRALRRRPGTQAGPSLVAFGTVEVDLARRHVAREGRTVRLTAREYELLRMLVTHPDQALTHRQILRELWGARAEAQTNYLRVFMARLRRKLEGGTGTARHLVTEPGVGYRFVSAPEGKGWEGRPPLQSAAR